MRLDNTIDIIEHALENDISPADLPSSPLVDSIEHFVGNISLILDDEFLDFNATHTGLIKIVNAIKSSFDDDNDPNLPPTTLSITSDQHKCQQANWAQLPTTCHLPLQ